MHNIMYQFNESFSHCRKMYNTSLRWWGHCQSSLALLPGRGNVDEEELREVVDVGRVGGLRLAPLHLQVILTRQTNKLFFLQLNLSG